MESASTPFTQASDAGAANPDRLDDLSKREREIVDHLAEGLSGAQIAERLVLSPETVRTHIRNAMTKLGASTRAQAVAISMRGRERPPAQRATAQHSVTATAPRREVQATSQELRVGIASMLAKLATMWDIERVRVYLVSENGLALDSIAAADGESGEDTVVHGSLPLGEGASGRAALHRRTQIDRSPTGGTTISSPMTANGNLVGVIELTTRPSRPIGRSEQLLIEVLSNRLGEIARNRRRDTAIQLARATSDFQASWKAVLNHYSGG